jgi:hypothetical protein
MSNTMMETCFISSIYLTGQAGFTSLRNSFAQARKIHSIFLFLPHFPEENKETQCARRTSPPGGGGICLDVRLIVQ